jgi:hydroxymethylpyrimidine/phosphomethylpyrimidine kinase
MQTERPYVLTIAGLDPCSGAGLTADIKTFEQLKVYGLAVCTGLTLQTEDEFISVTWRNIDEVKKEIDLLLFKYPVKVVKFGIVPSFDFLNRLVTFIKTFNPEILIIVDPIWQSSTGVIFNPDSVALDKKFLQKITLLTPNVPELKFMSKGKNTDEFISDLIQYTNVLLKGGHKKKDVGIDTLYQKETSTDLISFTEGTVYPKHGSGCVLSASIASHLALGRGLKESCFAAKNYIEKFLQSNKSLLGFHAA